MSKKFYDMSFLAWALVSLSPLVLASFGFILSPFLHLVGFFLELGVELGGASFFSIELVCVAWLDQGEGPADILFLLCFLSVRPEYFLKFQAGLRGIFLDFDSSS